MINKNKFDFLKLIGKPCKIREWMRDHYFSPRLIFILLGIFSTVWFLARVIPKPSRATYPCMRAAAPFMSGLIVYLLSVAGLTFASRKFKRKVINVRYISTFLLMFGVLVIFAINPIINLRTESIKTNGVRSRGFDHVRRNAESERKSIKINIHVRP